MTTLATMPDAQAERVPIAWRGAASILLAILVYAVSWEVTQWPSAVALAVLGALPLLQVLAWLKRTRRGVLLILAPYILSHVACALAALFIESGAYVPELDVWGFPNGAAARMCVEAALIYFVAGWVAGAAREIVPPASSRRTDTAFVIMAGCMLLLPIANFARLGIPLVQGLDRVAYYQDAGPMHLRLIVLFLAAAPSLGLLSLRSANLALRRTCVVLILAGLVVMVLSGEKFHGLLVVAYAASVPALLLRRTAVLRKLGMAAIAMVALSVSLIIYHYSVIYEALDVGEFAMGRLTGQAEVPWAVDNYVRSHDPMRPQALIVGELIPSESHDQGIEHLMVEVSPLSFVAAFIEAGSRFTMGFPALLTYYLGVWSLLGIIPVAVVVGLFVRLLLYCMQRNVFALWMAMNLVGYGALLDQVLLLGNLSQLFYSEPTRFVWVFLLLVSLFLPRWLRIWS